MRRYLVVANQTLGGDELVKVIRDRLAAGPSDFYVVVPATHSARYAAAIRAAGLAEGLSPPILPESDEEGLATARQRLQQELERLRAAGANAEGEVGDPDPMVAIGRVLGRRDFDEVIVSTLPPGVSAWLRMDLPHRVARKFKLPVVHVPSET